MNPRKLIPVLLLLMCLSPSLWSDKKEFVIKAAWLNNFARYVDWPESAGMKDTGKPFIIGFAGDSPLGPVLEKAYKKRKIKGKKVVLKYYSSASEIDECHLLFISGSLEDELPAIFSALKHKPVLTVGETRGFGVKGIHINFYQDGKKLRYEINTTSVRESSLVIGPSLLETGKLIKPRRKRKTKGKER